MRVLVWVFVLAALLVRAPQQTPQQRAAWNERVEPFRIIGNIYYVGAAGVSAFLIHSPEGSILLDGGLPETAPRIAESIAKLGFDIRGVKYLLNSHAHYDHSGGLAELKRLTGAAMVANYGDAPGLTAGSAEFKPVAVDRILRDGDTVSAGGSVMTGHHTPGHTKGCTSWSTRVKEDGREYTVLFHCSTSVVSRLLGNTDYPNIVHDYQRAFEKLQSMNADVFLGAHPSFFDMEAKRKKIAPGAANPFVDPGEISRFNTQSRRQFEAALMKERAALPAVGDPEAYAVYRTLALRSWPVRTAGAKQLILQEETSSGLRAHCTATIPAEQPEWRQLLQRWEGLNALPARLESGRNLGLPYSVMPGSDISAYFTGPWTLGRWWDKFHADHPSARGYFTASQVAFSDDRRRAIVYFADHCGGLCGHGQIYTLEKTAAEWKPVTVPGAQLCNWIS